MLANLLEDAKAEILGRLPVADQAAELLAQLIRVLRDGSGPPPVLRGNSAAHLRVLRQLRQSVGVTIEDRGSAASARDGWLVAQWFAAAVEQSLGDENRRLVTMLDALPDHLILQDREGRFLFVNASSADLATEALGRSREEVIGLSIMDAPVSAEFKRYAMDLVARAREGEAITEEFVMPGPSGPQWRESHMAPVYGLDGEVEAIAIASRDVHARKLAESRLFLLSKIGTLVGGDSSHILACLPSVTLPELADLTVLEVTEDRASRFTVAHSDREHAAAIETRLNGGERLAAVLAEQGAITTLAVPILVHGTEIATVTFVFTLESGRRHEQGDRAIADEVARRITQILENARLQEQLEQALAFRERVMGILGHDLRNPLSAVLSLSAVLMQRAEVSERTKEALGYIQRSAERMEQMIRTILDFTQIRFRGTPPLELEAFDLDGLVRPIVDELRAAHPNREVTVAVRGDVRGRWDCTRMGQVISNLVGNALTHGTSESPVVVNVFSENGSVLLEVSNRGPTIPPNTLDKLFEPFWQGAPDNKRRGLGLGLFIAQQIVQAHGGVIAVRSKEGNTTFTVQLPRGES